DHATQRPARLSPCSNVSLGISSRGKNASAATGRRKPSARRWAGTPPPGSSGTSDVTTAEVTTVDDDHLCGCMLGRTHHSQERKASDMAKKDAGQPAPKTERQRPAHECRIGRIRATIWQNHH